MTTTVLEPRTEEMIVIDGPGLPATIGLGHRETELGADWYERQRWAMRTSWQVPESASGGPWPISQIYWFDVQGRIERRFDKPLFYVVPGDRFAVVYTPKAPQR